MFYKACMETLSCDYSPTIYRYLVFEFFIKTLITTFIYTIIYRPYVFVPLGPYMDQSYIV